MNNKVILTIAGVILVAVVGFLFIFNKTPDDEKNDVVVKESDVYDYTKNNEKRESEERNEETPEIKNKLENQEDKEDPYGEHYDESIFDEKQQNAEQELPPTIDEIYDKQELINAREIAIKFLEAYYNFDGDNPEKSIENAKEFMVDRLYEEMIKNPEQPLHESFYREYKDINEVNTSLPLESSENIILVYHVEGLYKDPFEKKTKDATDVYILEMIKENDEYKVSYFVVNIPY